MSNLITTTELQDMVLFWLETPPNGYLGSGFGSDVHALLHSPLRSSLADELIAKMQEDIPLLGAMPSGTVNIYMQESGNDKLTLLIEVAGELIPYEVTGN